MSRINRCVLALLVLPCVAQVNASGATKIDAPLQLASVEWLVADNDVIVRGVVADIAVDENWNIVTLNVRETLKGAQAKQVQFVAYRFEKGNAALAQAKKSQREMLWLLKRHDKGVPGEAPDREKTLARHKLQLHAPFLPGRPGEPALPTIPLAAEDAAQTPALLTIDLRVVKTSDDIVSAMRKALTASTSGPTRSYAVALPPQVAQQTGFSYTHNQLIVPVDSRLETVARRLVQAPADFLAKKDTEDVQMLRLEGVKTLRMFPSEKNLALVRAWLDDPLSTQPIKQARATLVPAAPAQMPTVPLPTTLAQVPEISFQKPLTKAMNTTLAQLHTAVNIDGIHLLNHKKTDAFIETLMRDRPDLAGLSFAMGDKCRMKREASKKFVAGLEVFRRVENVSVPFPSGPGAPNNTPPPLPKAVAQRYQDETAKTKINPSASVAVLMQVLGHADGHDRLGLAKYLKDVSGAEATRALAKLAIFSAEDDIRAAALEALQKRNPDDYTEIFLTGLSYPWPAVAERTTAAVIKLNRKDLVPQLIDVLDSPDPRAPQTQPKDGKKVTFVRELVKLNHHHNCLLCHAPAPAPGEKATPEESAVEGITAQVPVPSESMVAYYRPSVPDILVRLDVTYLRQDFSMKFPVANADPWPELQRYDFLVRTREVNEEEALDYQKLVPQKSPYHQAALTALRELTGLDAAPTAAAWRKATRQ